MAFFFGAIAYGIAALTGQLPTKPTASVNDKLKSGPIADEKRGPFLGGDCLRHSCAYRLTATNRSPD